MYLSPPPIRAACPASLLLLVVITLITFGEQCQSRTSLLCSLLQSPVTSCRLCRNTFLSTIFSDTLSVCCSTDVRNQVACWYKAKGNIIFLLIITFLLLDSISDDATRGTMWQQPMPKFNLPIFSPCKFDFFNIGRLIVASFKNLQK